MISNLFFAYFKYNFIASKLDEMSLYNFIEGVREKVEPVKDHLSISTIIDL
jgi:hypothetical protein